MSHVRVLCGSGSRICPQTWRPVHFTGSLLLYLKTQEPAIQVKAYRLSFKRMDQNVIRDISTRFQQMMASRRQLSAARPDSDRAAPSSSQSKTDPTSDPFFHELMTLSKHPQRYQKPGLLDTALEAIDLGRIYSDADSASEQDTSLGYQDHVIKALLRWFKEDYFTWVNSPVCDTCGSDTVAIGTMRATDEEVKDGAQRTELFRCKQDASHTTRFPRYDDPTTLLRSRRGRCGEFANCFTLLCIALGSRARWVWNAEDHVWTEVYSTTLRRWVHCDSCENAWDSPQIYAVGWGKKMSYCIGFSSYGTQDVTRRYVRDQNQALPRDRASEEVIESAMTIITKRYRSDLPPEEVKQYEMEDEAEEQELATYQTRVVPTKTEEEQARESGDAAWTKMRGEAGKGS